jgi:hypothetical protein
VEYVAYAGWKRCVRLSNGTLELIVTAEVGPRIIRFGRVGGSNEFAEYPGQLGLTGGTAYRSYGGHRLWVAPETAGWTDHPDNEAPDVSENDGETLFTAPVESGTGLRKSTGVSFLPSGNGVRVLHTVTNLSSSPVTCAPWALSVMAPGGVAIVPQEPFVPHTKKVLPARPTVLWNYTDMTDERWSWGKRFIRLRQDPEADAPQKAGVLTTDGWLAYHRGGRMFVKRFRYEAGAVYPDFNCNAEIFTNARMLELESLGPLLSLPPGKSAVHSEHWYVFESVSLPSRDDALEATLGSLLSGTTRPD